MGLEAVQGKIFMFIFINMRDYFSKIEVEFSTQKTSSGKRNGHVPVHERQSQGGVGAELSKGCRE